jgi:putative oxidoreductase
MNKPKPSAYKIIYTIFRVLFGLLLVFSSLAYFFKLFPAPEFVGRMNDFNRGMEAAIYLLPFVKWIELICGICFILNRYLVLAGLVILPITVNILGIHIFLAPEGLPVALFLIITNLLVLVKNRQYYQSLLVIK